MTYKNYQFDFEFEELIPPLPGGLQGEYHFAAKIIYLRSPHGKLLWKHGGELGEYWGYTKKDAEDNATTAIKKWIDEKIG